MIQSTGTAQRYCYDAAGRLAQVRMDDNTTVIASYGYGASNQRLKQTEGTTTICYAWAGNSIIGEYLDNGSTLTWQKCYVYLGNRLLATQVPGTATNATQFHHPDRLGTRVISNAGDIAYTENAVLPYGTAIDTESSGTTTNRRFTSNDRSHFMRRDPRRIRYDKIGVQSIGQACQQIAVNKFDAFGDAVERGVVAGYC